MVSLLRAEGTRRAADEIEDSAVQCGAGSSVSTEERAGGPVRFAAQLNTFMLSHHLMCAVLFVSPTHSLTHLLTSLITHPWVFKSGMLWHMHASVAM